MALFSQGRRGAGGSAGALPPPPPIHTRPRRLQPNVPSRRDCWRGAIWHTTHLEETDASEPLNHLIANKYSLRVNNYGDAASVLSSVEGRSWQAENSLWQVCK